MYDPLKAVARIYAFYEPLQLLKIFSAERGGGGHSFLRSCSFLLVSSPVLGSLEPSSLPKQPSRSELESA